MTSGSRFVYGIIPGIVVFLHFIASSSLHFLKKLVTTGKLISLNFHIAVQAMSLLYSLVQFDSVMLFVNARISASTNWFVVHPLSTSRL